MINHFAKTLLVAAACTGAHAAQAQTGVAVLGAVSDSVSRQPLAYATVVLKKSADPAFVLSTMTDDKGAFRFDNVAAGNYVLVGLYVGYKNYTVSEIIVDANSVNNKPLVVDLVPDKKLLKEVKVVGTKPFIEMRADKIVLNVAESPIAQGGTAADVLERAPGVVDQSGRYQVRGRMALVLIDGKPTNLSGDDLAELLAAMPSNSVERVEVLPNPPAKYDAAGGAVINLVTKKSLAFGTNGSVSAGVGSGRYGRYNGGLNLNHRREKLNLYGGYDHLRTKQYRRTTADRVLGGENRVEENSYQTNERHANTLRLGLDYDINKRNSVGVLIRGGLNYRDRDAESTSTLSGLTGPPFNTATLQTDGQSRVLNPSVNLYYRTVLDSAGGELKVNADYFNYGKQFAEQFFNLNYNHLSGEYLPELLRNNSPAQNRVVSLAADYSRPFGKVTKLEAGLKAMNTVTDNDIRWELLDDEWRNDARRTNHFVYREQINAAYATLSRTVKKAELQLGLRAEHTNTRGESLTLGQVNRRDYLNLFPNLSVNYNQSEKQQWGLAYQRRIDRFRFDVVNPFVTYLSPYAYHEGNPNIRPSLSDNYSLSHSYNNEISTSLNYSRHTNVLAEVYRRDPATNAIIGSDANLSRATSLDGSASLTKQLLTNKLTTVNTFGAMYVRYQGAPDPLLNQGRMGWMIRSNNTLRLAKGYKAEIYAFYNSPLAFGSYAFRPLYGGSLGLSKSVLDQAGTVTLNVSDPLNLQTRRYDVRATGIDARNVDKMETLFVRLNFTYKFGNKKVKGSKSRQSSIEDEKSRMESN